MNITRILILGCLASVTVSAAPCRDRFVWVFGWSLNRETDVTEARRVLETAADSGLNGAVLSMGMDTLCKKTPEYFRRLEEIQKICEEKQLEIIPAVFSIGYGGAHLSHDRNLAEGLPVTDAPLLVKGGEARLVPDEKARLINGDFEQFTGDRFKGFNFHDQPGEVSFADRQIKHGGAASMRLQNFNSNPHGHGRVMQEVAVIPHRCYRLNLWVKTEGFKPAGAFQLKVLVGSRELSPRSFDLKETGDWQKLVTLFNSGPNERVKIYAGTWEAREGRLWLDDWTIEEVGPLNVLHRAGTPVTIRNEDGTSTYREGKDYAPLEDPSYSVYRVDRPAPPLRIPPGSAIKEGQRLRASWYHPMVIHDSQVTVCMADPKIYEITEHEVQLLAEKLKPRRVLLNMDEVRMGGTCQSCRGRDMGALLGECVTRQVQIMRKHLPGVQVYIWSDMLDPNHNAHGNYYLVEGDFTGSWKHVPKDLVVAVWGGAPREKSLKFFAGEGFEMLAACYYDANDLKNVSAWLTLARDIPQVRGFMYTPWQKKYALLPEFGRLLQAP